MRFSYSFLLPSSILILQVLAASIPQNIDFELNALGRRDGNASWLLPTPTQDPFFQPPIDWLLYEPGTALRVRYSPYRNISIGNCADTFQILYRTQDTNSAASYAVTTVYIPASHIECTAATPENCSHGIVHYEVPYDSCDPDATPSYLLQYGEPYGDMYELLSRGWFVSTPDYEGPLSSYTAGVQSGHATLDAMRAVYQVGGDFGLDPTTMRQAIWGYSGGASAAEFTMELAADYAPELKIAGIVAGGTVPNAAKAGDRLSGQDTSGLAIAGILGITSQQLIARTYLDSRLNPNGTYNKARFYSACDYSGSDVLYAFENQNVSDYFIGGNDDLTNPILTDVYTKDSLMGTHGTPNMPVFIYKAIYDEMSPASETDALLDAYCQKGANILYHRNNVGGHNQELWGGRPRALEYLSAVLDDTNGIEIPKTGCLIKNVTVGVSVTLVPVSGGVLEGPMIKPYSAITVTPVNVSVLANGSVLYPVGDGTFVLIDKSTFYKRNERIGFGGLMKRVAGATLTSFNDKLDRIGALKGLEKGWISTLDAGIYGPHK